MNFRHYKTCLARAGATVAFAFAAAAALGQDAAKQAKPVVYAGIGPAAWVARELACDRVEVRTLLPDGCDPHTFEPAARDIAKLAESQAYFSLDLPFEQRVKKILVTQKTGTGPVFSGSVPVLRKARKPMATPASAMTASHSAKRGPDRPGVAALDAEDVFVPLCMTMSACSRNGDRPRFYYIGGIVHKCHECPQSVDRK